MTRTANETVECPRCGEPAIVEMDYDLKFLRGVKIRAVRFVCVTGCAPSPRTLTGIIRRMV